MDHFWLLLARFIPALLDLVILALMILRAVYVGGKLRNLSKIIEKFLEENGK